MKKKNIEFRIDNIISFSGFTADFGSKTVYLPIPGADYSPINRLFSAICNLNPNGFSFKDVFTEYKYGIGGILVNGIPDFGKISDCMELDEAGLYENKNSELSSIGPNYIPVPVKSFVFWNSSADDSNSCISWTFEKEPEDIYNFNVKVTIEDNIAAAKNVFNVNYCDLCYAAGKLGTDVFKMLGVKGFKRSFANGYLDLEKIILLKEYALYESIEDMKLHYSEDGLPYSDFEADLKILAVEF